ncbi:MAG: prepilin-type N-terminal cleavage/methylation domain-containing protein [Gammaproteobacteria bacterium]
MSFRERILSRSLKGQSGFTLVEMAIVLVIIGLILSAVTVGKDLQRKADYRKAYTKFISGWKQAYDQFYQDFGYVVGDNRPDSENAPTGRVGGGADNTYPNNMTCAARGPAPVWNGTTEASETRISTPTLEAAMRAGEIAIPQGTGVGDMSGVTAATWDRGRACQYQYWDSNGIARTMEVSFRYLDTAGGPDTSGLAGNVMVISGLTADIAKVFDIAIDGIEESRAGRFRIANGEAAWANINPEDAAAQPTVTAYYKMTQ